MNNKKILIIDDTLFMSAFIAKVLDDAQYETVKVYSGEEALEYLNIEKPDMILLDVVMTGMSGFDVLKILRQDFRYNLIPIIMLTGLTDEQDRLRGLELGADDYIAKPFNPRELLARVNNTLVRLERSRGVNPLTGLRGNNDIEAELKKRIAEEKAFAVLYMDINSFKSYNDVYGFGKGDAAIKMTSGIITNAVLRLGGDTDFVGHVGGDDFIAIVTPYNAIAIAQEIIDSFDAGIKDLYNAEDAARGYIETKNRAGKQTRFGLIGLSVAIVFSDKHKLVGTLQLAEIAALLKHEAKAVMDGKSAYVD